MESINVVVDDLTPARRKDVEEDVRTSGDNVADTANSAENAENSFTREPNQTTSNTTQTINTKCKHNPKLTLSEGLLFFNNQTNSAYT